MVRKIFITLTCALSISVFIHTGNSEAKLLLIVGCGRSGTAFSNKYFSALGLDMAHEKPGGRDGCVSWPMVFNSYSPWGPVEPQPTFKHIFHQVRNPLDVISSWYINLSDLNRDEWIFIRSHIKEIMFEDSLLVSCAKYWYYWNLYAEKMSEWRFRVEDIENELHTFITKLNITKPVSSPTIPSNTNAWLPITHKISWNDLKGELPEELFNNIQNMALRYGYSIED